MIKNRRNSERGRGQGRASRGKGPKGSFRGGRNTGAYRRGPIGVNARPSASAIAKSIRRTKNLPWQNALLEDSLKAAGLSGLENGTKLHVSDLDIGVSNEDIRGTAEVVFARRSDAFKALKRYNNVQLDGRPMKIQIVGARAEVPVSARVNVVSRADGGTVVMRPGPGRTRSFAAVGRGSVQRRRGGLVTGRSRSGGRGRGVSGGGRGRLGRKKGVGKSADELDKELENYH